MTEHVAESQLSKISEGPCMTGRCAWGEPCRCNWYRDWIVRPSVRSEPVSMQLLRRRHASWRCPRLESGYRDPISKSRW